MSKRKLTLTILLFLVLTDILETLIQFCFKKAAITESDFTFVKIADLSGFLHGMLSSPFLWVGLISVFIVFTIWSTILSKIDLSVAVPIASFSYILVPLVSIILFHEKIVLLRWIGITFILTGVIFVSITSEKKEERSI